MSLHTILTGRDKTRQPTKDREERKEEGNKRKEEVFETPLNLTVELIGYNTYAESR